MKIILEADDSMNRYWKSVSRSDPLVLHLFTAFIRNSGAPKVVYM
jgi:hypothetical protein